MLRPLGDHCLLDGEREENDCAILTVVISFSRLSLSASVVIILVAIDTYRSRMKEKRSRRCFQTRDDVLPIRSGEL